MSVSNESWQITADNLRSARAENDRLRAAIADIAFSGDMTFDGARRKAARVYAACIQRDPAGEGHRPLSPPRNLSRIGWQFRMWLAEKGLTFWQWLASAYVPMATLRAFIAFLETLPREPE